MRSSFCWTRLKRKPENRGQSYCYKLTSSASRDSTCGEPLVIPGRVGSTDTQRTHTQAPADAVLWCSSSNDFLRDVRHHLTATRRRTRRHLRSAKWPHPDRSAESIASPRPLHVVRFGRLGREFIIVEAMPIEYPPIATSGKPSNRC